MRGSTIVSWLPTFTFNSDIRSMSAQILTAWSSRLNIHLWREPWRTTVIRRVEATAKGSPKNTLERLKDNLGPRGASSRKTLG